jgi:hypothetical protein
MQDVAWWPIARAGMRIRGWRRCLNIFGFIEVVDITRVVGWAYCPEDEDAHLEIRVALDEFAIGSGVADGFREDLQRLGFGDGDHGFAIAIDIPIEPEALDDIEVLAIAPDGETVRLRMVKGAAPSPVAPAPPEPPPPPAAPPPLPDLPPLPAVLDRFPLPDTGADESPVFILGCLRTGGTALAHGLLRCGPFQGAAEGHFIWMLPRLLTGVVKFYDDNLEEWQAERATVLARVPQAYMESAMRAVVLATTRALYPSGRWIDRTPGPEMVAAAPLLRAVWPNARFIFLKRRAIENMASRLNRFPGTSFREHCRDWARVMQCWLDVRDELGEAAIELDQRDLALEPVRIGGEIARFLDLGPEATDLLARALAEDRPERTTVEFAPILDISQLGWSPAQTGWLRELCTPMMEAHGYTYGEDYRARPELDFEADLGIL